MADNNSIPLWQWAPSPVGGRPTKLKSATEFWDKCCQYFKWIDDNPWQVKNANQSNVAYHEDMRNAMSQYVQLKQRAYTLYGLCAFIGINSKWADFKKSYSNKAGFPEVFARVEAIVAAQQIDGAMIHQFDPSLVARLNGIADKTEVDVKEYKLPKLDKEDLEELKRINGI